jgi:predicted GTPase
MKTPAKLRSELSNAILNIRSIKDYLNGKSKETSVGIGDECSKTAELLENIINKNQLPETYKVAVVGRFKAGKSSFVNELLETKLAGEDTSPETAAVTSFTYGPKVEAKINLIDKDSWEIQKKLYAEDPKHIDAHRARMWDSFTKPKKNSDGIEEIFDLNEIEKSLINSEKNEIIISFDDSLGKGAEKKFRDKLKLYTSGTKPYHCLVSSISITTPSALLKDGIELVDTPGLDDTERFRVSLTENSVEHVDAILFLTKSGVAYGQSEKDFLLSLLRKGTIKQLMIVITQVDQTYEQHVKSSNEEDEEPQSINQRITIERMRIREEIRKTLEELSGSDTTTTKAYVEQFSNVEIIFTSVVAHRDFKSKRPPSINISQNDPGGLILFKNSLSKFLSTESRISNIANIILQQSRIALEVLADSIEGKISALRNTKNREEVERRLSSFREQFKTICEGTSQELSEIFKVFNQSTDLRLEQHKNIIENIALKAEKELNKFRAADIGRHWRTRRNESWGFMHELQSRVANRIFPTVQEMLESHIVDFSSFVKKFEKKFSKLTKDASAAALDLELGEFSNFDIKKQLKESTNKVLDATQNQIVLEQEQIIKLLDTFVNDEVEEKITDARRGVANIWGQGTTSMQQHEVNYFYDQIETILSDALSAHVTQRNFAFARILLKSAEHAPREAFLEVDLQLDNALENLREAAEISLNGKKEQAENLLNEVAAKAIEAISALDVLQNFQQDDSQIEPESDLTFSISQDAVKNLGSSSEELDWAEKLREDCKTLFVSFNLKDGESGWPMSRIFDVSIFVGANIIRVVDPYLFKSHQLRNLQELFLLIIEHSNPKTIEVHTLPPPIERQEYNKKFFDELCTEIFNSHGIDLKIEFSTELHDRYIFSDSGFVAKLGRGLDIYKPSTGLAVHRQESRKVRACEVIIFKK